MKSQQHAVNKPQANLKIMKLMLKPLLKWLNVSGLHSNYDIKDEAANDAHKDSTLDGIGNEA